MGLSLGQSIPPTSLNRAFLIYLDAAYADHSKTETEEADAAPPSIQGSDGLAAPDTGTPNPEPVSAPEASDAVQNGIDAKLADSKELTSSDDFEYAISLVSLHPALIQIDIDVHATSGIDRFRAVARYALQGVHDRHRRWLRDFRRHRRDFCKTYVSGLVDKLIMDEATHIWQHSLSGYYEIDARHELLSEELAVLDKGFYSSLARLEGRKSVVHLYVIFATPRRPQAQYNLIALLRLMLS